MVIVVKILTKTSKKKKKIILQVLFDYAPDNKEMQFLASEPID